MVFMFQVFCEDLNSNTVFKLFILVWSYEGMEVMNLGCEKSYEKFSNTLVFEVFITFFITQSNKVMFSVL